MRATLDRLELRALFSGEHDERDAICEVHSGAGGTDAQDWTEMLLRMYSRWAQSKGFDVEVDETQEGQEAGITSATFIVKGRYAFGMLAGERGVHRLIRISPFDANARRQTAFASFDCVPALEAAEEPDIDPTTCGSTPTGRRARAASTSTSPTRRSASPTCRRVSSCRARTSGRRRRTRPRPCRSSPPGSRSGQREEQRKEMEALSGEKRDVAFGSQIRTYTLAPYQLVKDERTRFETGNVQAVIDGDLDGFVEAYLQWSRAPRPGRTGT